MPRPDILRLMDLAAFVPLHETRRSLRGGISPLVLVDRDGGGDAFETVVVLSDTRKLDLDLLLPTAMLLL